MEMEPKSTDNFALRTPSPLAPLTPNPSPTRGEGNLRVNVLGEPDAVAEGIDHLHHARVPFGRLDAWPKIAVVSRGQFGVELDDAGHADVTVGAGAGVAVV